MLDNNLAWPADLWPVSVVRSLFARPNEGTRLPKWVREWTTGRSFTPLSVPPLQIEPQGGSSEVDDENKGDAPSGYAYVLQDTITGEGAGAWPATLDDVEEAVATHLGRSLSEN